MSGLAFLSCHPLVEHPCKLVNYTHALQMTSEQWAVLCRSNVDSFFHYPNPKIFRFVHIQVLLVLKVLNILKLSLLMHCTDVATSDFVPNKVVPFFFSGPEAGPTNRVHIRHSVTQVPLSRIWEKYIGLISDVFWVKEFKSERIRLAREVVGVL
jgi:hypothetical protein